MSNFKRVIDWNIAARKTSDEKVSDVMIDNQVQRVVEEANELVAAIDNSDRVEILDAVCDIMFTYYMLVHQVVDTQDFEIGLELKQNSNLRMCAVDLLHILKTATSVQEVLFAAYQVESMKSILESEGYDVDGAFAAVCDNNDLKFVDVDTATEAVKALTEASGQDHTCVSLKDFDGSPYDSSLYFISRNSDNKVCKPLSHPKVDLLPFLPQA